MRTITEGELLSNERIPKKTIKTHDGNNNQASNHPKPAQNSKENISSAFQRLNIHTEASGSNPHDESINKLRVPNSLSSNDSSDEDEASAIEIIDLADSSSDDGHTSDDTFDFDTLQTDDSSEDEDHILGTNRAPIWSSYANRNPIVIDQENIKLNVIDQFFGSKAENVAMCEIFELINPNEALRRRSSLFWNTPPRYSTLPKH